MLLVLSGFSQGQTCSPTDPDFCNPPCSNTCVDIINNTDCELNFIWGFQGGACSDIDVPAGYVTPTPTTSVPALPWIAPCMRFCDQHCECPTMFRVLNNNPTSSNFNNPVDPWGGAIFNCCWNGTYSNIFNDCTQQNVHVDVSVTSNDCITFRFYY
ncbi:MAG: hypothetical protein J5I91_07630 [Bacteroidetes bacterium]|nr:hypothetical protein [Bacteroidota bacterium]